MGKSKKRTFNKKSEKDNIVLKREEIVKQVIFDIKNDRVNETTIKHISLFGITSEELTDAGAVYEELKAINKFLF